MCFKENAYNTSKSMSDLYEKVLRHFDQVLGPFLCNPVLHQGGSKADAYVESFRRGDIRLTSSPELIHWFQTFKAKFSLTSDALFVTFLMCAGTNVKGDPRMLRNDNYIVGVQSMGNQLEIYNRHTNRIHTERFYSRTHMNVYLLKMFSQLRTLISMYYEQAQTHLQALCMLYIATKCDMIPRISLNLKAVPVTFRNRDDTLTYLVRECKEEFADENIQNVLELAGTYVTITCVNEEYRFDLSSACTLRDVSLAKSLMELCKIDYDRPFLNKVIESQKQFFTSLSGLFRPKTLCHAVGEGEEWMKMDGKQSLVRYPIRIPSEVTTRTLTQSQVITQEFMKEREETSPFLSVLCHPIDSERVICPLSIQPFRTIPENVRRELSTISGGLVADQTGSGKTLSLLIRCLCDGDTNLIVVPDVLLEHWIAEIEKHTTLRVYNKEPKPLDQRKKPKIAMDRAMVFVVRGVSDVRSMAFNHGYPRIILTTHNGMRSSWFLEVIKPLRFRRLIVDEAHRLTSVKCDYLKPIYRDFTWVVTATPYENQNMLFDLLQVQRLQEVLGPMRFDCAVYYYWMSKSVLDTSHFKVHYDVRHVSLSAEERAFFEQVHSLIAKSMDNSHFHLNVTRYFRILERLGAGGYVHKELILKVLECAQQQNVVPRLPVATERAFANGHDDCGICLTTFVDPLQLRCRHVVCTNCYQGLRALNINRCPQCRSSPIDPVAKPLFEGPNVAAPDVESKAEPSYRSIVNGVEFSDSSDYIYLGGKIAEMKVALDNFIRGRQPGDQLVIFSKYEASAPTYRRLLETSGLRVSVAGLLATSRSVSMQNIEGFRRGETDALLISNRYSTGFDLYCAKELWMMNVDLSLATMEQSIGRITRVSQKHESVTVRIFVGLNMFDDWLWRMRATLTGSIHTRGSLYAFYYFLNRHVEGSLANSIYTRILKPLTSAETMNSLPLVKKHLLVFGRNELSVDFSHRTIYYQSVRMPIHDLLSIQPAVFREIVQRKLLRRGIRIQ